MSSGLRWTEGMFLRPQHFQQSDLYQSTQRRYFAELVHPFPWGVRLIDIDEEALENEILRVRRCELVFPDGLVFRYPEAAQITHPSFTEPSFKDAFAATMESLGVYACVPSIHPGDAGNSRFVPRSEHKRDLYDPSSEAPIEFVIPSAELIFTNDPADERLVGFDVIKIAEIRRTGRAAPRYEISRRYIPPLTRSDASSSLLAAVRQAHDQMCAAGRTLGGHRRARGAQGLAAGAGDLEQLIALQALNTFAPALQHVLAHGGSHPFDLYAILVQLRGALIGCAQSDDEAVIFPEYRHTNLAGCLFPVIETIRRLLELLLPTHYEELPLQRVGFSFSAAIGEELMRDCTAMVLAIQGPGSTEIIRRRIEGLAKISSVAHMRELVRFADRGVPARYVEQPPPEIPRSADLRYFVIEMGDPLWKKIRDAGDFCLYLTDAEPELNIRLFVVRRRGRRG